MPRSMASTDQANPRDGEPPDTHVLILLRIGEIFLKRGNRRYYMKAFTRRTRRVLADFEHVVITPRRLSIELRVPRSFVSAVRARLERLFGLQSFSVASICSRDIEAIQATALALANRAAAQTRFKVEAKRRDKTYPLPSPKISELVGGFIDDHGHLIVDVRHPQLTIRVEIESDRAIVFGQVTQGPGGLPIGTSGRAGLLLSGGIDSPVAAWLAMRRGLGLVPIYFHSFPYTGNKSKEKVIDLTRILSRWHGQMRIHVVHFTDVQKTLRNHGWANLAVLLYRRMMMRTAARISESQGCKALITGECLGQVASQTLENLGVIAEASPLPVLRPLIAYDKSEIIAKAREIGTYETSILPYDDCCSLFVPNHPRTRARLAELTAAEAGLDIEAMAQELADTTETIDIAQ